MRIGFLLTLIFSLLLPVAASAVSFGLGSDGNSFYTISSSPQYPSPNGKAILSFVSSTLDLANATLSVSVGGKNIYQGSVQPVPIALGKAGSITRATVTVTSGGIPHTQTIAIQPQDVVLVVEPVSSAPVLYPGKPFVPLEGSARVVAVASLRSANGASINPSSLSYSWSVDGVQIANSSGIGKTAIVVASPLKYRAREISVSVSTQDLSLVGGASVTLTALEPIVRIYENDPLLGICFDRTLSGTYEIAGAESTLYAAPFSVPTNKSFPTLEWFLNGNLAQTGNSITLRPDGSGKGSASLSITASADSLAKTSASLSLLFGSKPKSNLFGL